MRTREQIFDDMLVLAAQGGRLDAFERLARRWHPRLLCHARRMTGDPEGAQEATQESWVAIARGLRRLQDPASFPAWALRITSRRCSDWIARRQRTRARSAAAEELARLPAPADARDDDLMRVREALRLLDRERRALMAMFYIDGLTVAEIARALGIPAGTVKSRLYHARERLRAALEVRDDR